METPPVAWEALMEHAPSDERGVRALSVAHRRLQEVRRTAGPPADPRVIAHRRPLPPTFCPVFAMAHVCSAHLLRQPPAYPLYDPPQIETSEACSSSLTAGPESEA